MDLALAMFEMVPEPDVKGYSWDRERVAEAGHANEHEGGRVGGRQGEWAQMAAEAAAERGPTLVPGEKSKTG